MNELIVLSGKGGTGKTSITSAFASFVKKCVICDADVDASNMHLIMNPEIIETHDFTGGKEAEIDIEKCSRCSLCIELCKFNAIDESFMVDPVLCEGCGVCNYFCPEDAVIFEDKVCGQWFRSETRFGPMVHARLGIAEENSGKLVTQVRSAARQYAEENNLDFILTDGPPGTGCPVIASMGNASCVLLVTEPTVSGLHDFLRIADLAKHFNIPHMLCVNKYDLNCEKSDEIEKIASERGIPVLSRIPFDPLFTDAMVAAKTIPEFKADSDLSKSLETLFGEVMDQMKKPKENRLILNSLIKNT